MAAAPLYRNGATASPVAPFRFALGAAGAYPKPLNARPIFLITAEWAGVPRHRRIDLADLQIPY